MRQHENHGGNMWEIHWVDFMFCIFVGGLVFRDMKLVKIELLKCWFRQRLATNTNFMRSTACNLPTLSVSWTQGLPSNVSELAEGLTSHPHEGLNMTWRLQIGKQNDGPIPPPKTGPGIETRCKDVVTLLGIWLWLLFECCFFKGSQKTVYSAQKGWWLHATVGAHLGG